MTEKQGFIEANSRAYHPICEYLEQLEWDGQERIRYVLQRYMGADASDFVYEVVKHFLMDVLTTMISASISSSTSVKPCSRRMPSMTSESTRFLSQPRETKKIVRLLEFVLLINIISPFSGGVQPLHNYTSAWRWSLVPHRPVPV